MNYYELLGIEINATELDIKKAYRARAKESHPDKPGGDEARFKEVKMAYDILSNPAKRRRYDSTLPPKEQNEAQGETTETSRETKKHQNVDFTPLHPQGETFKADERRGKNEPFKPNQERKNQGFTPMSEQMRRGRR